MRPIALALLVFTACGPAEPQLQFDFVISALLADTISELQVSLVTNGKSLGNGDCLKVQQSCLVDQIPRTRFVRVQDASGVERAALRFPLNLTTGATNSSQDVTVQGIPLGTDYGIVIEAITKGTPMLAGSTCDYIQSIGPGVNPRKLAIPIIPIMPPVNCDPRVEKP